VKKRFKVLERRGPEYRIRCPYCGHEFTLVDIEFMDRNEPEVEEIDCSACGKWGSLEFV